MKIRETKWEKCKCCGQRGKIIQEEAYGCDTCKKEIDLNKPNADYLQASIHFHAKEALWLHFCSWRCCLQRLKKESVTQSENWFIHLPYLSIDKTTPGTGIQDFWEFVKIPRHEKEKRIRK